MIDWYVLSMKYEKWHGIYVDTNWIDMLVWPWNVKWMRWVILNANDIGMRWYSIFMKLEEWDGMGSTWNTNGKWLQMLTWGLNAWLLLFGCLNVFGTCQCVIPWNL